MRISLSFSILIWAYLKRAKNNQASLYVRIIINVKRVIFATFMFLINRLAEKTI